jgi:hypothetical protein
VVALPNPMQRSIVRGGGSMYSLKIDVAPSGRRHCGHRNVCSPNEKAEHDTCSVKQLGENANPCVRCAAGGTSDCFRYENKHERQNACRHLAHSTMSHLTSWQIRHSIASSAASDADPVVGTEPDIVAVVGAGTDDANGTAEADDAADADVAIDAAVGAGANGEVDEDSWPNVVRAPSTNSRPDDGEDAVCAPCAKRGVIAAPVSDDDTVASGDVNMRVFVPVPALCSKWRTEDVV